jgi:hypothetical protein
MRSILERTARGDALPEIADITERLERIERAVTRGQDADDQRTATSRMLVSPAQLRTSLAYEQA